MSKNMADWSPTYNQISHQPITHVIGSVRFGSVSVCNQIDQYEPQTGPSGQLVRAVNLEVVFGSVWEFGSSVQVREVGHGIYNLLEQPILRGVKGSSHT